MEEKKFRIVKAVILVVLFNVMFWVGFATKSSNGINSEKRIEPVVNINNGDTTWHAVFYWKNIGTKNQPSFELISNNFLPLPFNVNIDISIQPIDFNAQTSII